ncbi:hypothetical protein GN956_G13052 [Arapaima gigas]
MREPLRGTLGSRKCAGAAARAVETEPRCKRDAEAVVAWRVTAGQHSGHRSETEGSTCGGEGTPEDLAPSTLCRQEVPSKRHPCQDSARCSCPVSYARLTTIWWPESQPASPYISPSSVFAGPALGPGCTFISFVLQSCPPSQLALTQPFTQMQLMAFITSLRRPHSPKGK